MTAMVVALGATQARADEIPEKYRETVRKGLEYLVKQQFKDGHWGANGDQYPVSMTGLAGMALLMEGSTVRDGKPRAEKRGVLLRIRRQQGIGVPEVAAQAHRDRRGVAGRHADARVDRAVFRRATRRKRSRS